VACVKVFRHLLLATFVLTVWSAVSAQESPALRLGPQYRKWLDEDVHWIITPSESAEFTSLTSDQARDKFVVDFWQRRNPDPASKENTFKEEHYRRLAYSNEHFAAGKPGWSTDRGRIYIVCGPPDSVEAHPASSDRRANETWTYLHWNGSDQRIPLRFVDECGCGDYRLKTDLP
jgi:GWxTD domain-containing protein